MRTPESCRLRWRDHQPRPEAPEDQGTFSAEQAQELKEAVLNVCQEKQIDAESPSAKIPWRLVSEKLNGKRKSNSCQLKW
jgi:hypothetical protein